MALNCSRPVRSRTRSARGEWEVGVEMLRLGVEERKPLQGEAARTECAAPDAQVGLGRAQSLALEPDAGNGGGLFRHGQFAVGGEVGLAVEPGGGHVDDGPGVGGGRDGGCEREEEKG
jgi:hypothetical protein